MRFTLIIAIIFSFNFILLAQDEEQENSTKPSISIFNSSEYKLDLKFIDPSKGSYGFDYALNLAKEDFNLKSKGFITPSADDNPVNSLIHELKWKINSKEMGGEVKFKKERIDPDDPRFRLDLQETFGKNFPRFFYDLSIHGIAETTQDLASSDYGAGISLSLMSIDAARFFDLPFAILRTSQYNNTTPLKLIANLDVITNLDNTALSELRNGDDSSNRINLNVEWDTGIFDATRINFQFKYYREFEAPEMIVDAGKDDSYFFIGRLDQYLTKTQSGGRTMVSLIYTSGELPPNFESANVLGAGFSYLFK